MYLMFDCKDALYGLLLILVLLTCIVSCVAKADHLGKISVALFEQVELRREQMVSPDDQRLKQMQELGLSLENLDRQLVYIYIREPLNNDQADDLSSLGVCVHKDSWIPAVGNHPLGFFIADIPVDSLESLAARDYIVRMDTAERKSLPLCPVIGY